MRKVYHMVYFIVTEVGGSSPYARGLLTDGEGGTVVGRIIPACPRMRGVYIRNPIASFTYMGSSPLARGLLNRTLDIGQVMGIIPARAGFTRRLRRRSRPHPDHPRSRGVYPPRRPLRRSPPGSSPLARGLPSETENDNVAERIIPARAGFTRTVREPGQGPADHPRSRGVYCHGGRHTPRARGSSPLARGLHRGRVVGNFTIRIIPARAGFTPGGITNE